VILPEPFDLSQSRADRFADGQVVGGLPAIAVPVLAQVRYLVDSVPVHPDDVRGRIAA